MSWTSWSARLSSLALNLPKVLASHTNQLATSFKVALTRSANIFRYDRPGDFLLCKKTKSRASMNSMSNHKDSGQPLSTQRGQCKAYKGASEGSEAVMSGYKGASGRIVMGTDSTRDSI